MFATYRSSSSFRMTAFAAHRIGPDDAGELVQQRYESLVAFVT